MITTTGRLAAVLGTMLASGAATNVARAAVMPCAGCFAVVDVAGRLVRGKGVASVTKSAEPGLYGVRFRKPISACAWTATISTTLPAELIPAGQVSLAGPGTAGTGLFVQTFNGAGMAADLPFDLLITC